MLIDNKIKIKDYLDINVVDKSFDSIDDATCEVDVEFDVDLTNRGIITDVHNIKAVSWEYKGVKFDDEDNAEQDASGQTDESWAISHTKSKSRDDNYGLFITDVTINVAMKTVEIEFEC